MIDKDYLIWIETLKAGDVVMVERFDGSIFAATITRITAKGEILTNKGRFMLHSANGKYKQYGTFSFIRRGNDDDKTKQIFLY